MNVEDPSPGSLRDKLSPVEPPPELAHRVRRSLLEKGLVHETGRWAQPLRTSAIAASFLFVGFFLGRSFDRAGSVAENQRYALLLYGGESSPGEESASRRHEYGEWLRTVASGDRSFTGEELGPPVTSFGSTGEATAPVVGFFIVSAAGDAEAQSIAQTSPHLKHGGSIVVYRVID
jgi:hypothetical protein